ncbi:MAG: Holliday junction branch migration protein RuvA [Clostridia bacterium]|nr:Holliday junction branch migration protein RuvA [Clostridia bacterium]MEE1024167.1 Holliday junction branch migration protein RuvA [Acutalibacteraceae bacterium]
MLYSLRGKLIYTDPTTAVIECGGVGYKCTVTHNTLGTLPELGSETMLYTYMNVREDAVDLFGFATIEEQHAFLLLTSVNGVGPKAAISILSELTFSKLALAVSGGDSKTITKAQGVGPKLAQRIVLELKDKFKGADISDIAEEIDISPASSNARDEACAALLTLGYSQSEARAALAKTDINLSVEQMITAALKHLF